MSKHKPPFSKHAIIFLADRMVDKQKTDQFRNGRKALYVYPDNWHAVGKILKHHFDQCGDQDEAIGRCLREMGDGKL